MDWTYNGLSEDNCVWSKVDWEEAASPKHKLLEIGPRSTSLFVDIISRAKTLIWHGTAGVAESGVSLASTAQLVEAMVAMCEGGGTALLGDDSVEMKTVRWCLQRNDRESLGSDEAVGSLVTEGVTCSVHSDNFAVQTLDEPFPGREGSEHSVVSQICRSSCGDEDRPIKERYFLEPAPNSLMDLEGLTNQSFKPPAMSDPDNPANDGISQHTAVSSRSLLESEGFRTCGRHEEGSSGVLHQGLPEHTSGPPEPPGSSKRASLVSGDAGGVGSDDSKGGCSHKTRGEVTDPTNPVFSVAIPQAQLPSTHVPPERNDVIDDSSFGLCNNVVQEGSGSKASQFAGRNKSMQKPIGFRPDLAESLGMPAEPEVWLYSVGSPIHVELSESASGETLGEGYKKEVLTRADSGMRTDPSSWPREGKPELSYSLWDNPLGDTSVSNCRVRDNCPMAYPQGPEGTAMQHHFSPNDWCERQGELGSGASSKAGQSGFGPCEAASVILPGFGQWGLRELSEGSAEGESTLVSTGSHVLNTVCPSDLPRMHPQSLMWKPAVVELGEHETCEVVSSQGRSVYEHVQEREDGVSSVSGTVVPKHVLRRDLSGAFPAVAKEQVEPGCHMSGPKHAEKHQLEGQAGKVYSGQHQPEGQAGKVHSGQHQPEGQAGKVHSAQHQPEGQAGKVHSGQHQPEGQAGKVHSGQHRPEGQAGQSVTMHSSQVKRVQPGALVFPMKGREEEHASENTQSGQAMAQAQGVLSSGGQCCVRGVAVPVQAQAIGAEAGSKELAQLANQVGSLVPSCMLGVGAISGDVSKSEPVGFRSTSPRVETGQSGPGEVGHDPNPKAVDPLCGRSGQGVAGQDTRTGEAQASQKGFYQQDPCEAAPDHVRCSSQSNLGEAVPDYLRFCPPTPSAIPGTKFSVAD